MIKILGKDELIKYTDLSNNMQNNIEGINYPIDCPWVYDNVKISEDDIILDLGCGQGGLGLYIAKMKKCKKLYGLDRQHHLRTIFEERCLKHRILNAKFIHANADNKIPCPNEYFDITISVSALEHNKLEIANRVVKEISRVLKKGGKLITTVAVSIKEPYGAGNIAFTSEDDIIYAFTNDTGMTLTDENSLTGWKWNDKEISYKYDQYVESVRQLSSSWAERCSDYWLPVGVIVEKV